MASRVRQSTAGRSTPRPSQIDNDLPPYEPLRAPLNDDSQRSLRRIETDKLMGELKKHLTQANALVSQMAGEVNVRLHEREDEVQRAKTRRDQRQRDATEAEQQAEAEAAQMRDRVEQMTERMEASTRRIIDGKQSMTSMTTALDHARDIAQAHTNADQPASVLEAFQTRREQEEGSYQQLPPATRYAEDNDYVGFRREVHDAQHPDDGVRLPHADSWFTESGEPTMGQVGPVDEDEDEDVAVARENLSTKCPLTLQEMREPVKSLKCPHSFEKYAIMGMIRGKRDKKAQCPMPGCDQWLHQSDLHEDPLWTKKIQRRQQAQEARRLRGSVSEEDDEDTNMVDVDQSSRRGTIPPKPEPGTSRPRRVRGTIDLGSEDD